MNIPARGAQPGVSDVNRRLLFRAILSPLCALAIPGRSRTAGPQRDAAVGRRLSPRYTAPLLQGYEPGFRGLAITPDAAKAFVTFRMEDVVLVIDLRKGELRSAIDVSAAGTMLHSNQAVLSLDGALLFVANQGVGNVMVIDASQERLVKVLPISAGYGDCLKAGLGGKVYIGDGGSLAIVSTADLSYRTVSLRGVGFESFQPSLRRPEIMYCVNGQNGRCLFHVVNLETLTDERQVQLPAGVCGPGGGVERLLLSPAEDYAYLAWLDMVNLQGYGNISAFDLRSFRIASTTPIPDGVRDLGINPQTGKLYAVGTWEPPQPGRMWWQGYIVEYDPGKASVTKRIPVFPSSAIQALQVDPVSPRFVYNIEAFAALLRKVDTETGAEVMRVLLNRGKITPHCFAAAGPVAYVGCLRSPVVHKLDLTTGKLVEAFWTPDSIGVSGLVYSGGNLYRIAGNEVLVMSASDGSLLATHRAPDNLELWGRAVLFLHERVAALAYPPGGGPGRLLMLDPRNFNILSSLPLEYPMVGGNAGVTASPDGSKLYVFQGVFLQKTVLWVIDASTLAVRKRMEIPTTAFQGGGGDRADFDLDRRIVYLTGFNSVYKLHMDTDELLGMINLYDVYGAMNRSFGWAACAPVGVHISAGKDRLLLPSHDGHSLFTYDLRNDRWVPRVVNLQGYDPSDSVLSPDRKYLYVINSKTDTIARVDTATSEILDLIPVTGPSSQVSLGSVIHGATFVHGAIAPGQILAIRADFGHLAGEIGPPLLTTLRLDESGRVVRELGGTKVYFDGQPAPILYTYASQVGVVVPYSVAKDRTRVQLEYEGSSMAPFDISVVDAAPGIFTLDSSGKGQAAALNENGTVNGPGNPATRGSVIVLYATGEGQTDPPGVDGKVATDILPRPRLPVKVYVQGREAVVRYAGAAPGLVAGVMQVNIQLPMDIPSDDKVTVLLVVGNAVSQPGVTIAVR